MRITRIFTLSAALMCASVTAPAYAFMAADAEIVAAEGSQNLTSIVNDLSAFVADEANTCEQKLARANEALTAIDQLLDLGIYAESDVLSARDAIVEVRRTLKCAEHELAEAPIVDGGFSGGGIAGDGFIDDGLGGASIMEGGFIDGGLMGGSLGGASFGGGGLGGGTLGGGIASGGGIAGGGGLLGGGSSFGLLAAGAATAIAVPLATSSSDDPGPIASPSTSP